MRGVYQDDRMWVLVAGATRCPLRSATWRTRPRRASAVGGIVVAQRMYETHATTAG